MHIALLIYGSLDTMSGGYLYDRELVAHLRARGALVEVVSLPWHSYGCHLTHNLSPSLYRRLRHARWDVLLQDELNHPSLFALNGRLQSRVNYPIVSVVHHLRSSENHPPLPAWVYRRVEQRYLQTVDGFIFNSATTRAATAALCGTLPPHVVATPAGSRFQPRLSAAQIAMRAQAPGPLRVVFVGNVIPRKGLHVLLGALARLPRGAWRLDVVGDTVVAPIYADKCRRQAAVMGLQDAVEWHGRLPDAALADVLTAAHVLAVPSSYEGFGIVYLEGMGFGVPAIATTSGAAHEIVSHGENGFLVPPGETAVLAQHLQKLHTERETLARMGQAAQARWQAHPTWAESMRRAADFLVGMVDNGR